MKIEQMDVSRLIPYARNARTHSPEQVSQIAGSIKEFGFNNPILVDENDGIIAGHGRALAAHKLGKTHQNILVFAKGDGKKAAAACGQVEAHVPDDEQQEA